MACMLFLCTCWISVFLGYANPSLLRLMPCMQILMDLLARRVGEVMFPRLLFCLPIICAHSKANTLRLRRQKRILSCYLRVYVTIIDLVHNKKVVLTMIDSCNINIYTDPASNPRVATWALTLLLSGVEITWLLRISWD